MDLVAPNSAAMIEGLLMHASQQRIREVFDHAVELPPSERPAYVHQACGGDSTVFSAVTSLLKQDVRSWHCFDHFPGLNCKLTAVARMHDVCTGDTADTEQLRCFPDQVAGFRVLDALGSGSVGVVFRAEQKSPRRVVALKTIRAGVISSRARQRFRAEADILARFQHPGIAQVFESGVATTPLGDVPYMAMELIEGKPLLEVVHDRHLDTRGRLELVIRIAEAIAYAHQKGVIHRDLKPTNILISATSSGRLQPKVLDFGIARLLDSDPSVDLPMTMAGELLGTPAYMSPEQLCGNTDEIDTRTDIYSLGLILFELLARRPAFPSRKITRSRFHDHHQKPPRLSTIFSEFRGDLDTIIEKATAPDREMRYQTVAEFSQDLKLFLGNFPIHARRPSSIYSAARFISRHRLATVTAAAFLGTMAIAAYGVWSAKSQRLDLALDLAGAWLDESLRMQRTAGESSGRGEFMEKLFAQVEQLSNLAPDDRRVMSMRAALLTERGYVAMNDTEFDFAASCFGEALQIQMTLADDQPSLERKLALCKAIVRIGDVAGNVNDADSREHHYREALQIQESLANNSPDDLRIIGQLGWSYERLAALLDGQPARAAERWTLLQKQVEAFAKFGELATVDEERGICVAYAHLASMAMDRESPDEAYALANEAVRHGHAAIALSPNDRHAICASIKAQMAHNRISSGVEAFDYPAAAVDCVRRASELLGLDDRDRESRRTLVSALFAAAEATRDTGDLATANEYERQAQWHFAQLTGH